MTDSQQNNEPIIEQVTVFSDAMSTQALLKRWTEAPENEDAVKLSTEVNGLVYSTTSEDGFFDVLINIRNQLRDDGLKIAILGAGRNVYPSPMIARMGDGDLAYFLTMKKQALREDLVSIFTPCERDLIVSVAEQEAFYASWLKSLR